MDPELYQKVVEHNAEVSRLKNGLSRLGLVISPLLLLLGCLMFAYPAIFKSSNPTFVLSDYFYFKAASALIILGLYFPYLSIRWLLKNRITDRA